LTLDAAVMKKRCIFWWFSPLVRIPAKEYFDLATEFIKKQYGFWVGPERFRQAMMMNLEATYVRSDLLLLWLCCTGHTERSGAKWAVSDHGEDHGGEKAGRV
jgi:hypothetical protein